MAWSYFCFRKTTLTLEWRCLLIYSRSYDRSFSLRYLQDILRALHSSYLPASLEALLRSNRCGHTQRVRLALRCGYNQQIQVWAFRIELNGGRHSASSGWCVRIFLWNILYVIYASMLRKARFQSYCHNENLRRGEKMR